MFDRFTRRVCGIYSISPGDLWLLTHPEDAEEYELLSNENTIRGEVLK
jgi:hypothetical protein